MHSKGFTGLLGMCVALAAGCGGGSAPDAGGADVQQADLGAVADVGGAEASGADVTQPVDVVAPVDVELDASGLDVVDASPAFDVLRDTSTSTDLPNAMDAADVQDAGVDGGAFGAACSTNATCSSGNCNTPLGRCTRACAGAGDCPTSWSCTSAPGSAPSCSCTPTGTAEVECDGLDNNCDGLVDDHSTMCGGMCVDVRSSTANCGACSVACSGTGVVCVNGACTCPTGQTYCNGACVNTSTSLQHCGACNAACSRVCNLGACVCPSGTTLCGDTCTNLQTNSQHCGSCGNTCPVNPAHASTSCVAGVCRLTCATSYTDCDGDASNGCEVNLQTDTNHCGSCDTACSTRPNTSGSVCTTGVCGIRSCSSGFSDCDNNPANGCEASIRAIPNCGRCGAECGSVDPPHAVRACLSNSCGITCQTGFFDCDTNPANGCERSTPCP